MSTITSGKSVKEMLAMRTEIDAAIIALGGGKTKKASVKRPGTGGAWSAFSKKIIAENAEEVAAYKLEHPYDKADRTTAGAHLKWAGIYKAENEAEWLAFKAEWDLAHPKTAKSVASAGSAESATSEAEEAEESSEEAAPSVVSAASATSSTGKKRGPKKLADMTPEQRAKHDAGVAARKAKREAEKAAGEAAGKEESVAAPVAPVVAVAAVAKKATKKVAAPAASATPEKKPAPAPAAPPAPKKPVKKVEQKVEPVKMPVVEESDDEEEARFELFPFTMDGNSYFRLGCKEEGNDDIQWEGHLWYNKDGKRGEYVGCLSEDGGFEEDAEEPSI